jgi:hypothetical protein
MNAIVPWKVNNEFLLLLATDVLGLSLTAIGRSAVPCT